MTTDSNGIRQGIQDKWAQRVPRMTREERIDLLSRLENSARWNTDFVVMMSLATDPPYNLRKINLDKLHGMKVSDELTIALCQTGEN